MKKITLELELYNCCGGGHCGPQPGYMYACPDCKFDDVIGRTGYPLAKGDILKCGECGFVLTVTKKISDTKFTFQL